MTRKVLERNAKLERLAVWCTYIALFLNPLGFDFVQYWLFEQLGSIWTANLVLYIFAGGFFILSWILRRIKRKIKGDTYIENININIHYQDENSKI